MTLYGCVPDTTSSKGDIDQPSRRLPFCQL